MVFELLSFHFPMFLNHTLICIYVYIGSNESIETVDVASQRTLVVTNSVELSTNLVKPSADCAIVGNTLTGGLLHLSTVPKLAPRVIYAARQRLEIRHLPVKAPSHRSSAQSIRSTTWQNFSRTSITSCRCCRILPTPTTCSIATRWRSCRRMPFSSMSAAPTS